MWADDATAIAAVKATKRTPLYRQYRPGLQRVAPADVWRDDEATAYYTVLYELGREQRDQVFLCFVVDAGVGDVRADSILRLATTPDGWRVRNDSTDGKEDEV